MMGQCTLLISGLLLAACGANYPDLVARPAAPADGGTCLVGGRALVGENLTPIEPADVCFAGQKLTLVGPAGQTPLPQGVHIERIAGKTVLPGLIDTHIHVTGVDAPPWNFSPPSPEHNLEAWLWAGITTAYDMGGPTEDLLELSADCDNGELQCPHLIVGHEPITAPEGHPIPAIRAILPWPMDSLWVMDVPVLEGAEQAPSLVAEMKAKGARFIKIIQDSLPPGSPKLPPAHLRALVDAAHAAHLKAVVHVGTNEDALEAAEAGADHLAHIVYREAISSEVIEALKARNISITVTASGFANSRAMAAGTLELPAWVRQATDPEIADSVTGENGKEAADLPALGDFFKSIAPREVLLDNVRRLHAAGVLVLVGTDSALPGILPGASYHQELEFLAEAGINNEQLLRRATALASHLFMAEPDFGSLGVSKRADVLVVNGNPLDDLSTLRSPSHIYRSGRLHTQR